MPRLQFDHTEALISDLFHTEKLHSHFEETALEVFYYQYKNNPVYKRYCDLLEKSKPQQIEEIPFLPIETFKTHKLICGKEETDITFNSSGTTGMQLSYHHVQEANIYKQSFLKGFHQFYGDPSTYCILALLPNYMEKGGSSLVYMVDHLIRLSSHPLSGFFLDDHQALEERLSQLEEAGQKTLLIGVSYALLDFVENRKFKLHNTIVMETGGMKGRRVELPRPELHKQLKDAFSVAHIHSEYGMTELLSQAYSKQHGLFYTPPWMKVLIRESNDPFSYVQKGKTGGINIIDLANVHSCAFIQTQDLGKQHNDMAFEILGRFDTSDIRGCNLLVAD